MVGEPQFDVKILVSASFLNVKARRGEVLRLKPKISRDQGKKNQGTCHVLAQAVKRSKNPSNHGFDCRFGYLAEVYREGEKFVSIYTVSDQDPVAGLPVWKSGKDQPEPNFLNLTPYLDQLLLFRLQNRA